MENGRFRKGDLIRIADMNDPAYSMNHFYEILQVHRNGYMMRSLQTGNVMTHKHMKKKLKRMAGNFKNMRELIDTSYRLVTEAEKVLYGRKEV